MVEKYISIIRAIIVNPYGYFSREMPEDDSVKEPLIFAVVVSTIAAGAGVAIQSPLLMADLPVEATIALVIASLILTPFGVLAVTYVSAFFVHIAIFMICPKRKNFKQTLKVLAYSNATTPLIVVPLIGTFVAGVFNTRSLVFGLSAVHNVSALKIFMLFVIIPIILMTGLIILIAALFGAVILSVLASVLPSV